jgi:hypothetical protein
MLTKDRRLAHRSVSANHSSGGLLMSRRRPTSDSGEPDLWSNGSIFTEPSEPISIDRSPHIPLQQTTGRTKDALVEALSVAPSAVSAADARGFFEHTEYESAAQLL